ncbi:1171_t:CDS:1, partial [Racocetra persica]
WFINDNTNKKIYNIAEKEKLIQVREKEAINELVKNSKCQDELENEIQADTSD